MSSSSIPIAWQQLDALYLAVSQYYSLLDVQRRATTFQRRAFVYQWRATQILNAQLSGEMRKACMYVCVYIYIYIYIHGYARRCTAVQLRDEHVCVGHCRGLMIQGK